MKKEDFPDLVELVIKDLPEEEPMAGENEAAVDYYYPNLDELADKIVNWRRRKGFETNENNIPEKIALIHSELSEALEAHRSKNMGEFYEELADVLIRLLDLAGSLHVEISVVLSAKMQKNEQRPRKHDKEY